ncbi:TPA: hypothetical protein ACTYSP_004298 [Citrobacter freundii]
MLKEKYRAKTDGAGQKLRMLEKQQIETRDRVNRPVLVPCFLRFRLNNGAVDIPPLSYCSVIHEGVHSYILITISP